MKKKEAPRQSDTHSAAKTPTTTEHQQKTFKGRGLWETTKRRRKQQAPTTGGMYGNTGKKDHKYIIVGKFHKASRERDHEGRLGGKKNGVNQIAGKRRDNRNLYNVRGVMEPTKDKEMKPQRSKIAQRRTTPGGQPNLSKPCTNVGKFKGV